MTEKPSPEVAAGTAQEAEPAESHTIYTGDAAGTPREEDEKTKAQVSASQNVSREERLPLVRDVSQMDSTGRVVVEGRLECTLADFERSCLVRLEALQRQPSPDTGLIALLCDAVRVTRECHAPEVAAGTAQEPLKDYEVGLVIQLLRHRGDVSDGFIARLQRQLGAALPSAPAPPQTTKEEKKNDDDDHTRAERARG